MGDDGHKLLRRYPLVWSVVGVSHTLLCAGIVFGWASLLPLLQAEGVDLTPASSATVFSFGAIGNYLSNLPFGLLLDKGGPKICGIFASVLFALGLFLCSLAEQSTTALAVGYGLLGFVGPALQLPTLHLAKLWTGGAGFLMSAQAAAFDGGTAVFAVASLIHQIFGTDSSAFFRVYMVVPLFTLLTAIFVWPNSVLEDDHPEEDILALAQMPTPTHARRRSRSSSFGGPGSPFLTKFGQPQKVVLKDAPVSTILSKPSFWCLAVWVSVHILKLNFVVATINHQLEDSVDGSTKDQLINIFGAMLPFGFVIMPVAAYLLDKSPLKALQLANVFGVVYGAALTFAPSSKWLLACVVFPLVATSRQLVYSSVFHELGELFGFKNYGFLLGLCNILVSAFSLLQNVLVQWADDAGSFLGANTVLLILTMPLFAIAWSIFEQQPVVKKKLLNKMPTREYGAIETEHV